MTRPTRRSALDVSYPEETKDESELGNVKHTSSRQAKRHRSESGSSSVNVMIRFCFSIFRPLMHEYPRLPSVRGQSLVCYLVGLQILLTEIYLTVDGDYEDIPERESDDQEYSSDVEEIKGAVHTESPTVVTPLVWRLCRPYFPHHNIKVVNEPRPRLPIPTIQATSGKVWSLFQESLRLEQAQRVFQNWISVDPGCPSVCKSVHIDGKLYQVSILYPFQILLRFSIRAETWFVYCGERIELVPAQSPANDRPVKKIAKGCPPGISSGEHTACS